MDIELPKLYLFVAAVEKILTSWSLSTKSHFEQSEQSPTLKCTFKTSVYFRTET